MTENTILSTEGLTKKYKDRYAVNDLSINVTKGEVYGFLGQNGAGKSTTLRMLLTLIQPTSGKINVFDHLLSSHRTEILSKIGSIVEKPDFYKYLSATQNVNFFARMSGMKPTKTVISDMLRFVGLEGREKGNVGTFSHGMKQRLGLAQALIHDPELIILDEPTTGLDPQGIIELRNLIMDLSKNRGKTIILSSHILSEIELIADSMVIVHEGRAIAEGKVKELLSSAELKVSFKLEGMVDIPLCITESGYWSKNILSFDKGYLDMQLQESEIPLFNAFLVDNKIGVLEIQSRKKLEDYFLKLTSNTISGTIN